MNNNDAKYSNFIDAYRRFLWLCDKRWCYKDGIEEVHNTLFQLLVIHCRAKTIVDNFNEYLYRHKPKSLWYYEFRILAILYNIELEAYDDGQL